MRLGWKRWRTAGPRAMPSTSLSRTLSSGASRQSEERVAEVKIGALCWNQYTDWPSLLQAGIRADELGYVSLWTCDQWLRD